MTARLGLRHAFRDGDVASVARFFSEHLEAACRLETYLLSQPEWFCVASALAPALQIHAARQLLRDVPDAWFLVDETRLFRFDVSASDSLFAIAERFYDDDSPLGRRLVLSFAFCLPALLRRAVQLNDPATINLLLCSFVFQDEYTPTQRKLVLSSAALAVLCVANARNVVNVLVAHGAEVETLDLKSPTGDIAALPHLVENGTITVGFPDMFYIEIAADEHERFFRELLQAGADARSLAHGGWSRAAASSRSPRITRLLLEEGCVDADGPTEAKTPTPLMRLVGGDNDLELIRLLLDHNADTSPVDSFHRTALIYAARDSPVEVVQMLLDSGADATATDKAGRSALHHAVLRVQPSESMVKLLLQHGADPLARDKTANSVVDLAVGSSAKLKVLRVLEHYLQERGLDENGDMVTSRSAITVP